MLALYGLLVLAIALPAQLVFLLYVGFPTAPWYSLSLLALMAGALEAMLQIASPAFRLGRLALAAVLLVVVTPSAFESLGLRQTNMDLAAAALAGAGRDDFVVVSPWFLGVSFNRYYAGAAPWATIPPLADTSVHRTDLLARQLQAEDPIGPLLTRSHTAAEWRLAQNLRTSSRPGACQVPGSGPGSSGANRPSSGRKPSSDLQAGHRVYWVGLPAPNVARPPGRLPPLPGPVNGTVQGIYCANWTLQVAAALKEHGDAAQAVPLPPHRPPQPYERARVWATTGRPGQVW